MPKLLLQFRIDAMKIVADPNIPFVREAFAALGEVTLDPGRSISAERIRDADVLLVRSVTAVNAALMEGSRVKFVATATIGTDHVDEAYLASRGIGFASAAGSNANSVAEYVIAALLELAHRHKFRLSDKQLGVIGVGHVGSRVVRYAEALGMRVLQNDPPRQRVENLPDFVSLDRVLTESDIVTLHVPLDDTTRHLLHRDNMRGFTLINTARGAVVDNKALLKAIDGERIRGAVLDVWENEPNISPELLDIVEIGTPHIAGYSFDGKVNGVRAIYEAACKFFGFQPTWTPTLPPPVVPKIELSVSSGEDDESVIQRIIKRVYDIAVDDAALRKNVLAFDKLRAEYPIRREFFNTELALRGASESLRQRAAGLGFKVN
jgi:erythronate-4-phosphate dehydrogenase